MKASEFILLALFIVTVSVIIYNAFIAKEQTETTTSSTSSTGSKDLTGILGKLTGTTAFVDSVKDKVTTLTAKQETKEEIEKRKQAAAIAAAALAEANKKKMVIDMTKQISFALVDAFKVRLAKFGFKLFKVFNKVIFKIGVSIASYGARQLTRLGLKTVLKNIMKKMSKKVGFDAIKLACRKLGAKAAVQSAKVAKTAASVGKTVGKVSNPASLFFEGISMVLDLADATGNNVTELNYSNMMTNEMFFDLKYESNIEFEQVLAEEGIKNNVVLSPLDKLTPTEMSEYIAPILIQNILNMPNPSGKTNVETWIEEKLAKLIENEEITQAMIDNNSYKTNEQIMTMIETKVNDELEIFIDLPENKLFIDISTGNITNKLCTEKGGILVDFDKTTFADYKGYDKYPNFSKEIGVCSYKENQCIDGIAYNKSKLVYDEKTNPEPDTYGEWDGNKCKMADSTAMLNCDTLKLKYDSKKTLCKDSDCVTGLCTVDGTYCSKYGMQYLTNYNISNEKKETQKDCLTDVGQDIAEFIFGTVISRGFKTLLGIGTKQEGEACINGAQCNGNVAGKIGTLSCCKNPKTGLNTCTPQISDWAGIGYCPSECVGKPFGAPGTCPIYEKCDVTEDDKGDGTTCSVNCERKFSNKNAFRTLITDKCVTCNNEGKDPKTGSYVYERTLAPEDAPDACKIGGVFGDCKYFVKKDAKGNDLMTFQHGLTGKCYSCQNDTTGKPYNRTLSSIDAGDACKASSCDAVFPGQNSTEYLTSGGCYKCPANMSRTPSGLVDNNASDGCKHNGGCPAKFPGSFEHRLTGQCYKCPTDAKGNQYIRTLSDINEWDACKAGSITGDCSLVPTPAGIPNTSSFQDGLSGNCYSCHPGFRNLNASGSGRECSMPCPPGWERDELAGLCFQCPGGYIRNAEPVWSDKSCSSAGWDYAWNTAKASTQPFVRSWTSLGSINARAQSVGSILSKPEYVGSINAKSIPVGSILSKPQYVGSMNAPATLQGSLIKPLTKLQDGPLTRKKKVIEEGKGNVTVTPLQKENFVQENPKYIGVM